MRASNRLRHFEEESGKHNSLSVVYNLVTWRFKDTHGVTKHPFEELGAQMKNTINVLASGKQKQRVGTTIDM